MSDPLIPVSSSWVVDDGVVWPADRLPKPQRVTGKITAARAEIRRRIAERFGK